MPARDDENVNWSLRVDVGEGDAVFVLVDSGGGDGPFDDLAEKAAHGSFSLLVAETTLFSSFQGHGSGQNRFPRGSVARIPWLDSRKVLNQCAILFSHGRLSGVFLRHVFQSDQFALCRRMDCVAGKFVCCCG